MLTILEAILNFCATVANVALWAIETCINLVIGVFETVFAAATALLPSLPEAVAPPSVVRSLNWFLPIGSVLTLLATMLAAYVVFLTIRWVFRKVGTL